MQIKYTFSGHDTFICKHFWLKKGYDFVNTENKFTGESAVVSLGVGKNMVSAIRYWLKAFGLTDENDKRRKIADYLFGENGKDSFVEDIGTIWLLHYLLVKTGKASLYSLFFNEFIRKRRIESFTKPQLHDFLKLKCEQENTIYNENTINRDITTFLNNYIRSNKEKSNIEDNFVGLLVELDLVKKIAYKDDDAYEIIIDNKEDLPYEIVLFSILDQIESYGNSISFNLLLNADNAPGRIFVLSAEGLYEKIEEITKKYPTIVYSETAGNKELQFKESFNKFEILDAYYKSI